MELFGGDGEPDIRERPFEELPGLEGFNDYYKRNGGVGGGINRPDRPLGTQRVAELEMRKSAHDNDETI
jgi:hypothetical protein